MTIRRNKTCIAKNTFNCLFALSLLFCTNSLKLYAMPAAHCCKYMCVKLHKYKTVNNR